MRTAYRQPSLPDAFVPFAIAAAGAAQAVARELATTWSVPATFQATAKLRELEQVWVPAYLLHARLAGSWQGERGEERGGIEGAPTADWDYNWSSQDGTFDEPLVLVVAAVTTPIGNVDGEKLAALLRDEPGSDAVRLEPSFSTDDAIAQLPSIASTAASRLADDRCGGDRQRSVTTSEEATLVSVRRIWLPHYRGTYTWRDETHAVWVDGASGTVRLMSKPSDGAEVAAREALNAANKKASNKRTDRIVFIALAPFAFILAYYVVATVFERLFR